MTIGSAYMVYGGRYTFRFFDECAKKARKRNDKYLLNKVGELIKNLEKCNGQAAGK